MRGSAPDLSRTTAYRYDTLDQLTQEVSTPAAGSANTGYSHTFSYDLSGNPTSPRLSGTAFNADNQFTTSIALYDGRSTAIAHNGNGDPLTVPFYSSTFAAAYDPEDRLTALGPNGSPDFYARYDSDGLRAWNYPGVLGDTYYLTDGGQTLSEMDDQGNAGYFDLFGATGREMRSTLTLGAYGSYTALTAYTYDPQGSVVQPVVLSPEGGPARVRVQSSSAYDGFGLSVAQKSAEGTFDVSDPVSFGGQFGYYQDTASVGQTGLYLLGHRYYNAFTGRFVTRDPIGYGGGINLYGLAGNNPVNEIDPDGTQQYPNQVLPPLDDGDSNNPYIEYSRTGEVHETPSVAAVLVGRAGKSAKRSSHPAIPKLPEIKRQPAPATATGQMVLPLGLTVKVHGNNASSQRPTHTYEILDGTGDVYKYGESSDGVNANGKSIRAEKQVRKFMRETGGDFASNIIKTFTNKAAALQNQADLIRAYERKFGRKPEKNRGGYR